MLNLIHEIRDLTDTVKTHIVTLIMKVTIMVVKTKLYDDVIFTIRFFFYYM